MYASRNKKVLYISINANAFSSNMDHVVLARNVIIYLRRIGDRSIMEM